MKSEIVQFWVDRSNTPHVETKPFYKSQRMIDEKEDGSKVFEINVVINHGLERVLLGFGEAVKVFTPYHLVALMSKKLHKAAQSYE